MTEPSALFDPGALRAVLADAASGLAVSFRPMFGGIMAYAGGRVFASLSNRGLALKLDPAGMQDLLALGGQPLRYEPGDPPSRSYALVPPASLADDGASLRTWVARSAAHASALPAGRRR